MFGRWLRPCLGKQSVQLLFNSRVLCSSLTVIKNNELTNIKASQLEKQRILDELLRTQSDNLIYDPRLDADMAPFSETVDLEYLDDLRPPLENTFNLAHYVNRMPTLQRLVDLGVDLYVLEQTRDIAEYLIRLDFERDIKKHLLFLKSIGIGDDELGIWITCNPIIFRQSIDNLKLRLEYLKSKKFTKEMVDIMIRRYPPFLNIPLRKVDAALSCFQRELGLTGNDIRSMATHHPKIIHFASFRLKEISFSLKKVMEFNHDQARQIVVGSPSIIYRGRNKLEKAFDLMHWQNGYSRELIVQTPHCLSANLNQLIIRIGYLKTLDLFQPDPKKPCFTPIYQLCLSRLQEFVEKCSRTSVVDYNKYLKTL